MRGRILLVVGIGVGYVLGAKAGRERYDQIAAAASRLWNSPGVQKQVVKAEDFVKDHAPDVAELVGETAKKAVTAATRRGTATTKRSSGTRSTGSRGSSSRSTGDSDSSL
jgi:hypothetical protein